MTIDLGGGRKILLADLARDGGWIWLVAGCVAIVIVASIYRHERRLVSRRAGLVLLSLRLLATLALVIALLDPIAARTRREEVRGRVILGVDRSASMETTDPAREGALAERLGRLIRLSPGEDLGRLSRLDVTRRLLASGLGKRLYEGHDLEAIAFAAEAVPGRLRVLLANPKDGDPSVRQATDWGPVLEAGLTPIADDSPVAGVVLFTDGRRNAPADPSADPIHRLSASGIPVFPVLIGSTTPPADVAIAAIRAPDSSYLGDTSTLIVEVKSDGLAPGQPIAVRLEREGHEPIVESVVAPGAGSATRPVAIFRVAMEQAGPQVFTARVDAPVGADARPDNNVASRTIRVTDDKVRVLLVEGEARWEFRYLRNALMRDPRVEVESIVLAQPPASETASPAFPSAWPAAPTEGSDDSDPLTDRDVIVLGDLAPGDVPGDLWRRLDRFVAERGGTLVLLAGPRSWSNSPADDGQQRALLPILEPRLASAVPASESPTPIAVGIHAIPDEAAILEPDAWPMLQIAVDPLDTRAVWDALPPLPWAVGGRLKPGAMRLLSSREAPELAIAATQSYGLGKVLWIGTDGTWRWRLRIGDLHHHRFWGQIVRWSADGRLAAGNRYVRFGPDRNRIAAGESIDFKARFADDAPGIGPGLLAAARVEREGELLALVPLHPSEGRGRLFEGRTPGLTPGFYVARLDVPELLAATGMSREALSTTFEVIQPETSERVELAASPEALAKLATATGGELLREHEADRLPDLLRARRIVRERTTETPLWDTPWGLGFFFLLLSAEWVVRKHVGLA